MNQKQQTNMKKLLLLLIIPIAIACSDDKDKEPAIDYISNSTIAGRWYYINGADSTVRIFENDIWIEERWHKYNKDLIYRDSYGNYKLSKEQIYYGSHALPYTIEKNVLTFFYADGHSTPYTKTKD